MGRIAYIFSVGISLIGKYEVEIVLITAFDRWDIGEGPGGTGSP